MIERFVQSLHTLSATPARVLSDPSSRGLRGDAADAVRLQLDCMQQALTPAQRAALHQLEELLDSDPPTGSAAAEGMGEAIHRAVLAVARVLSVEL